MAPGSVRRAQERCRFYCLSKTATLLEALPSAPVTLLASVRTLAVTPLTIRVIIMRPGTPRSNGARCPRIGAGRDSAHEWLALDVVRFLIALLRAQRIGEQSPGLPLGAMIAARERERLSGAALGLVGLAVQEPQSTDFYPQQRIIRLDAQRAIERRRRTVNVAVRCKGSRLSHERESGGREMILARRGRCMRQWPTG